MAEPIKPSGYYERRLTVDVTDKDLAALSVGQQIELRVTGTVHELRAGNRPKTGVDEETAPAWPPSMMLTVASVKVTPSNEFTKLAEDDEMDEADEGPDVTEE